MTIEEVKDVICRNYSGRDRTMTCKLLDDFARENEGRARVIGTEMAYSALLDGRDYAWCSFAQLVYLVLFFEGADYLEVN